MNITADGFARERPRILIVDDEPEIRMCLAMSLSVLNSQIIEAANGREGFEKAKLERPNIIILDVMMPVLDGIQACRMMKGHPATRDIPIMFLTAMGGSVGALNDAFSAGAMVFLSKPYNKEDLLNKVRILLESQQTAGVYAAHLD